MATLPSLSGDFISCNVHGEIVSETEFGTKFYTAFVNEKTGLVVRRGNIVRVSLENENDDDNNIYSIAQVLAVFLTADDELFVEVRWFDTISELPMDIIKRLGSNHFLIDEIVETSVIQDIEAGSLIETITVTNTSKSKSNNISNINNNNNNNTNNNSKITSLPTTFCCRYMYHANDATVEAVPLRGMHSRGLSLSEYSDSYTNSLTYSNDEMNEELLNIDIFTAAAMRLHISVQPEELPCREVETDQILTYLRTSLRRSGESKPLYISGIPGTGKTACVMSCIRKLKREVIATRRRSSNGSSNSSSINDNNSNNSNTSGIGNGNTDNPLPEFAFVMINGLQLQQPADAYSVLLRRLTGEHHSSKTALKSLQQHFEVNTIGNDTHKNKKRKSNIVIPTTTTSNDGGHIPIIVLIDEMDFLMEKSDNVLYNFFQWPLQQGSRLIVLGIANTMDLPERLSTRVQSRLKSGDSTLERQVFRPYTYKQIQTIVEQRLQATDVFKVESLGVAARIAATTAGDVRAALKICQRSIEIHRDSLTPEEAATGEKKVIYQSVQKSAAEFRESPLTKTIAISCPLDKAIIVAVCKHIDVTGLSNITTTQIYERIEDLHKAIAMMKAATTTNATTSTTTTTIRHGNNNYNNNENSNSSNSSSNSSSNRNSILYNNNKWSIPTPGVFRERISALLTRGILIDVNSSDLDRTGYAYHTDNGMTRQFTLSCGVSDVRGALKGQKSDELLLNHIKSREFGS